MDKLIYDILFFSAQFKLNVLNKYIIKKFQYIFSFRKIKKIREMILNGLFKNLKQI